MALRRRHFADPHVLLKTEYSNTAAHVCDICRSKMAGLTGYRCIACDFDIHEACADYFKQTISFFAHPWHNLTLSRLPTSSSVQWSCDLCMEVCQPGALVYRCTDCLFDVHPLCTMLPQNIRSPLHPRHDLRLVPSVGTCMCGCEEVSVWNYVCSCPLKVNIACASGNGAPCNGGRSNTITCNGGRSNTITSSDHHVSTTAQASQTSSSGGQSVAVRPSRRSSVAKFLLKASLHVAMDAATGGMASPVLEVLSAAFS